MVAVLWLVVVIVSSSFLATVAPAVSAVLAETGCDESMDSTDVFRVGCNSWPAVRDVTRTRSARRARARWRLAVVVAVVVVVVVAAVVGRGVGPW